MVTHASQPDVSAAPVAHGEWLQVPPLEVVDVLDVLEVLDVLVEVLDVVDVLEEVELLVEGPPQTLVLGTHTWIWPPAASLTAMQLRSSAQVAPPEQLGAQYWSPAN